MAESQDVTRSGSGRIGIGFLVCLAVFLVIGLGFFHVVQTKEGLRVYPKNTFRFTDTYVDMTRISVIELRHHEAVVIAMRNAGDAELVPGFAEILSLPPSFDSHRGNLRCNSAAAPGLLAGSA